MVEACTLESTILGRVNVISSCANIVLVIKHSAKILALMTILMNLRGTSFRWPMGGSVELVGRVKDNADADLYPRWVYSADQLVSW